MSLRIGVDLDGTVADLSTMYHAVEKTLFGEATEEPVDEAEGARSMPEPVADKERLKLARQASRRTQLVWRAIQETRDFWTSLTEIEPGAVTRLNDVATRLGWEVIFVTRRPRTVGASVQLQSQRWLVEHGFLHPSVVTLRGARGRLAHVLELDILLDDLTQNCVDVVADSKCRPLLVQRTPNSAAETTARQLKIGIVRSVDQAVGLLEQPEGTSREAIMDGVLKKLGLAG